MNRAANIIASLAAAAMLCSCDGEPAPRGVRVVLITLDTLRHDRFEPQPGKASNMPLTYAHAERGMIFDRYYSVSSVTQPAHATMFTGLQPWEHGITRNGIVLPESIPTVTETMKANGFETRAVVASYPLTKRFGFARGFAGWTEDFSHNLSSNKRLWEDHWKIESGEFFEVGDAISASALDEINAASATKQFFWFHYFDPHAPYGAASRAGSVRKRDIMAEIPNGRASVDRVLGEAVALYDKDVAFMDNALNRVLERLKQDEARFETHIIVVSDHGESLGEDNSVGHGARLTDAELHVPAFIISPRVSPGSDHEVVASVDIAPTLLSLAGIEMESAAFEGRDLTQPRNDDAKSPLRAFAIRRTFQNTGKVEQRLDGIDYPIEGLLFGAVDENGVIHRGNESGLQPDPTRVAQAHRGEIISNFSDFTRDFERTAPAQLITPEDRRALEALGYVQ